MIYGISGIGYVGLISFVFYRSLLVFVTLLPFGIAYPLVQKEELRKKRQEELLVQFRDMIFSLAACLNAGYSVENAFTEALRETNRVYGKDSMISKEIRLMIQKTRLNRTMEEALTEFANRSGLEEIKSFADVFLAARASGGELLKIISRTAEIISEKIRIRQEILTNTTSRRLEQKIMSAIPFGIVFYLEATSSGFFDVLYETMIGRVIMTGCLVVYLGAVSWGRKILDMENI